MKKILIALFVCVAMSFAASGSESKKMAAGGWIQAGNPGEHFGVDFMMRMGSDITLDIYAHLYLSDDDNSLGVYLGYFWNFYLKGVPSELGRMGFYVGPTGGIGFWNEEYWHNYWDDGHKNYAHDYWRDETGFAVRLGVTGGYQWEFPKIPLQFYAELSPVLEFHYFAWDDYYDSSKNHDRSGNYNDDDVEWKFPDFYFRIGLRFWF